MNSYELSRKWFDFCFDNPEIIKPNHSALYFFAVEHCNRLGWKQKFGFPTEMAKDAIGIKNYKTYINTLKDLVDWEFIEMVEKSKNQYSSNIIALVNYTKATTKALDKASIKHSTKHSTKQVQSIYQSIASVIKHITNKQLTIEQLTKEQIEIFKNFFKVKGNINIFHNEFKKIFLEFYLSEKGFEFYWSAKEATALNSLIKKIEKISGENNPNDILKLILDKIKTADPWIYENLSIAIINSKFNELISKIKNGKTQSTDSGYSELKKEVFRNLNK